MGAYCAFSLLALARDPYLLCARVSFPFRTGQPFQYGRCQGWPDPSPQDGPVIHVEARFPIHVENGGAAIGLVE